MPHSKQSSTHGHPATAVKTTARSSLISRNIVVSNRRTSIRLEPDMWDGLREICRRERASMHQICTSVSNQKTSETSLTAAIRVFVMLYFRHASTEEGHNQAGHGGRFTQGLFVSNMANYPSSVAGTLTKTSFT